MINLEQAESLIKELTTLLAEERKAICSLQEEINILKKLLEEKNNRVYDV